MNPTQAILHSIEEGKARIITWLVPLFIALVVVFLVYNLIIYRGLNDAQSMDNAQLARQIHRGEGFTTRFIRPAALAQLSALAKQTVGAPTDLFAGLASDAPRILPDTYNAPGYPYLLSAWFAITRTNLDADPQAIAGKHIYAGDRIIPFLNQIFFLLTAGLVFYLGWRHFDPRVAWLSLLALLLSDVMWQYSLTALSTSLLMFLLTVGILVIMEIFAVGEKAFSNVDAPFWPAWLLTAALGIVIGLACLCRLDLLVLVIPLGIFLVFIPRGNVGLIPVFIAIVLGMTVPWFLHMYKISGSPIGSNVGLLHYGVDPYLGNQIYCVLQPPDYNQLFRDLTRKEANGFAWHIEHAWQMLGTNPLIALFAVSYLHNFKRSRIRFLRWLVLGAAITIVIASNCGVPNPEPFGPDNIVILLFPVMLVIGAAFFFILLDRLNLQLWLVANALTILLLILVATPMANTYRKSGGYYNYPPYSPPSLAALGKFVKPETWMTTDMPWATAWYGDHASLWLPDTIVDFEDTFDNFCPSGLLLITPVLMGQPVTTVSSGEYKDWFPFIYGFNIPTHFPLEGRIPLKLGGPEYILWANRAGQ